ncbi:integrase, catalytic region, zinc finger, CCHC-type containing protein, partial [Tanacetum coccineum]
GVQNVGNQNGIIVVPGITNQNPNGNGNVVAARAEGNATGNNGNQIRCYNCRGLGHLARNCTVRPRRRDAAYLQTQLLIAQKEEAGIQLQAEEFDLMAAAADLDEIEEVNANCILMANLQQASTSGTQTDKAPVYDSDGSAEVHNYDNCYDNEIFNMFTQEEQTGGGTVDQHPATVEETRAYFESLYNNLALEVEKPKFVRIEDFKSLAKDADESLLSTRHWNGYCASLLRAVVLSRHYVLLCKIIGCRSSNLQTELDLLTSGTPKGTSTNTKFANQKVDETNDLSKPVTSNSVPTPQESKNVIAPGMFRINPFKPSREEKYVPIKVRAKRVMDNSITVSQPHVVTKKDVNSDSNGLSSTGVDNTAKTRRPQPRSNTMNDRVPSASKSSCNKNKEVEVEEHHRNLLLSKNKKHMSSECKHV